AGSYVPEFHPAPTTVSVPVPLQQVEAISLADLGTPVVVSKPLRWRWVVGAVTAVAALLLFLIPSRQTDLDKFWAPVLEPKGPLLICLGQPKAYFFNTAAQAELDRWFGHKAEAGVRPLAFQSIPVDDVVPAWDRLISIHDAEAFSRL